jgi:hypothetical protein
MKDEPPTSQPIPPSSLLPDEVIRRITAEELLRFEVQERLRKKETDSSDSKTVKFLNSPFGLFLLSAIFISGLGGLFQLRTEQLKQAEARREVQEKLLSEYRWRLNSLDRLIAETEKATDVDTKGADSILIYRIAYGATEFRTSLPEFQNESWAGIITQLDEFGISESAVQAINATNDLMSGPYAGQDSIKRGYFAPGILEDRAKSLHLYYDNARKRIYDTSVWRVFAA